MSSGLKAANEKPNIEFIHGLPGSGKTALCLELLKQNPSKTIYVTQRPAQADILNNFCIENGIGNETTPPNILTWDAFCKELNESGENPALPVAGVPIRTAVIGHCAEKVIPELGYFDKVRTITGFHRRLVDFYEEMWECCVNPVSLDALSYEIKDEVKDPLFESRMIELALIADSYVNLLKKLRLQTPGQMMTEALEIAENGGGFDFNTVIFDGFSDYQTIHLRMMKALAVNNIRVIVSLTWEPERSDIFINASKTAVIIKDTFNVDEYPVQYYDAEVNPLLSRLRENLFFRKDSDLSSPELRSPPSKGDTDSSSKEDTGIKLFDCPNPLTEIEEIAREIIRLKQNSGYDYNDIAIYIRSWENYAETIRLVFERFNIPCRWENDEPLQRNPFVKILLNSLELVADVWQRDLLFEILDSSYSNIPKWQVRKYISRAYAKAVRSGMKAWLDLAEELHSEQEIPELKNLLTELSRYADMFRDELKTIESYNKIIIHFVGDLNYLAPHSDTPDGLRKADESAFWAVKAIFNILATLQRLEPYEEFEYSVYLSLFKKVLEGTNYKYSVDIGADSGSAVNILSNIFSTNHRYNGLFVIGLLENSFPKRVTEDPFLRGDERVLMSKTLNTQLKTAYDVSADERLKFYLAGVHPRKLLYLTFPRAGDESDAVPAFYINELMDAVPHNSVQTKIFSLAQIAENEDNHVTASDKLLYECAKFGREGICLESQLESFNSWQITPAAPLLKEDASKKAIAWKDVPISVTELEQIRRCPFQHYAQYLLKIYPKKGGIQRTNQGQLLHQVLRSYFAAEVGNAPKSSEEMRKELTERLNWELQSNPPDAPDWQIAMLRFFAAEILSDFANREPIYRQRFGFEPQFFELSFGYVDPNSEPEKTSDRPLDAQSVEKPLKFKVNEDKYVRVCGSMDRVDIDAETNCALVIDYKLEGKTDWSEPERGGSLQMPLYVLAMMQVFGYKEVVASQDSLIRNERTRCMTPTSRELQTKLSKIKDTSIRYDTVEVKAEFRYKEWLRSARDTAVNMIKRRMASFILPNPDKGGCAYCEYGDLCRTDLFGFHDGEPMNTKTYFEGDDPFKES